MIKIKLPLKIVSPNIMEHWSVRSKRNQNHKLLIRSEWHKLKEKPTLPAKITLTRIAPRPYDEADNLRMAFKPIIDIVSDLLVPGLPPGHADADPRLHFEFAQHRGRPKQYEIEITIEDYHDVPMPS